MSKLLFHVCLLAAFVLASSQLPPGSRGVPPPNQSGASLKCRDDKQDCPLGLYCKGGVCHRPVICQNDSGCNAGQCCLKSGGLSFGACFDAPKAGAICILPSMGVPYCPCPSGFDCKAIPYTQEIGICKSH